MSGPDPASWMVPVTWKGKTDTGEPAVGHLTCVARANQIAAPDTTDPVRVFLGPVVIPIDDAGYANGELLASNYPGNSNQGYTWQITENLVNGKGMTYDVTIPIELQSSGVLLSNYAPTEPIPPNSGSQAVPSMEQFMQLEAEMAALQQAVFGTQVNPTLRIDFDDGLEGAPVLVHGKITNAIGAPITTAAAAIHGPLGMHCGDGVTKYGNIGITALNAGVQQYSMYVTINKVGTGDCPLLRFGNSLGGACGSMRLRSGGGIGIFDNTNTVVMTTTTKWSQGDRIRIDTIQTWDGSQALMSLQWAKPMESVLPAEDPISYYFPSAMPDKVNFGTTTQSASWDISIDTIRGNSVNKFMDPENPLPLNLTYTYETPYDTPMAPGQGDVVGITSLVPQQVTQAARHGSRGVLCSGAGPCRWTYQRQVYGATSFAQTYINLNSTVSGTPIGLIQFCSADGTVKAQIGSKSAGSVSLYGATVTGSNAIVSATHNVPTGSGAGGGWFRLAWKTEPNLVSGDCKLTIRIYYTAGENGEGTTYEELSTTYAAVGPLTLVKPGSDLNWVVFYDTWQTFPTATDWPPPYQPLATLVADFSQPGRATPTSVDIASHVKGGSPTARMVYSLTADGQGKPNGATSFLDVPVSYPKGKKAVDGFAKHRLPGLQPLTRYYASVANPTTGTLLGSPIKFYTAPQPGNAFTIRWVYGSCQGNSGGDWGTESIGVPLELAWKDVLAFDPHIGFDTGDKGYWGGTLKVDDDATVLMNKYINQQLGLPNMLKARQNAVYYDCSDDHEVSGNNGDSYNQNITAVKNVAMRSVFAMYDGVQDGFATIRENYGAFMIGNQIQVIMIDTYGMDRSPGKMLDNIAQGQPGAKMMMSPAQTQWLKDTYRKDVALNIIICAKTPLGHPYGPTETPVDADTDKMWAYGTWFDDIIADMATARTTNRHVPVNVTWWGGDRHANAYVSKATNPRAPGVFSCLVGSGWSQHGLTIRDEETYDYSYGFYDKPLIPVLQYIRGTLQDDPVNGKIHVTAESRYTPNTLNFATNNPTDSSVWAITNDPSFPAVHEIYDYVV